MGLSYVSVRFIRVDNQKLAILYYLTVFLILMYVIVYSVIINKGYQSHDTLIAGVAVKVKGSAIGSDGHVYDSYDLIQPPVESSAMFVTTRLVETLGQTRAVCEGREKDEMCNATVACVPGTLTSTGNMTGQCGTKGHCLLSAWCPIEDDNLGVNFTGIQSWTAFVKINVKFPVFGDTLSNSKTGLVERVNLFSIDSMLQMAGQTYSKVESSGAILLGSFLYDCNLDKAADKCLPTISFSRIDDQSFSPGFNFRYIYKATETGTGETTRDLFKSAGIRVIFQISGNGGRFDIVALTTALGSGLALLGVATLICDFVLQYLLPEKDVYRKEKFEAVNASVDEEARQAFLGGR